MRSISETFSVTHLLDKPFQQLSGGEKARVQLARCCIKEAPLLLADEPIASLDPYYPNRHHGTAQISHPNAYLRGGDSSSFFGVQIL